MKKMILLCVTLILSTSAMRSQVTIGSLVPPSDGSLLDLKETAGGTSTKGLLLPRVSLQSTISPSPLVSHEKGMLVYNTDSVNDVTPGIYYNNGNGWKSVYSNATMAANNGLTMSGDSVQLGGALTKPTNIITNGSDSLLISGTGTTAISSPLAITSGSPGAGKVLVSDASGNVSWGSVVPTAYAGTKGTTSTTPIGAAPAANYSYTTYSVSCPPGRSIVYAGFNVRNTSTYGGYVTVALSTSATTFTQFTSNTTNPNSQGYAPSLSGFALLPNSNTGSYTASIGQSTFYVNNTGTGNITLYLWGLVQGVTNTANTALNSAVSLSLGASENFVLCVY